MPILTLAREPGTLNSIEEKRIAEALGVRIIDKQFLERRFEDLHMDPKLMKRWDEKNPGPFAKLFGNACDTYLETLRTAVLQEAAENNVMFVGRAVHLLLTAVPNVLRVRFVAPKSVRIARLCAENAFDSEAAEKQSARVEADRTAFFRFHFNADWRSPVQYDWVINRNAFTFDEIIALFKSGFLLRVEHDAASVHLLRDRALAQMVLHMIMYRQYAFVREMHVTAEDGVVTLHGIVQSEDVGKRLTVLAAQVPHVREVKNALEYATHTPPLRKE